jgi:hypothetical protein
MNTVRAICLFSPLSLFSLTACDENNGHYGSLHRNQPQYSNGAIQQPTTVDLYPSQDGNRLYVMVTAVGSQSVSMPLAFDTGSAGFTLYAPAMSFPSSILDSTGLVFPAGQTSMSFNGITITNQTATRSFGGADAKTETGNIGFAQVTFGDAHRTLTTNTMRVFLYYLVTNNAPPHTVTSEEQQGWFGVDTQADLINAISPTAGATPDLPCSPNTGASCYVISVLKHLTYAPWLNAGFALSHYPLQPCNILQADNCAPVPMLTVGLSNELESKFSQALLNCPPPNHLGPDTIDGYLVCDAKIPASTVTITAPNAPSSVTLTQSVIFDSGNQAVDIDDSSVNLTSPLSAKSVVSLLTPSGFTYSYMTAATGVTETIVDTGINTAFGINFFTEHNRFIDFTNNTEGWM